MRKHHKHNESAERESIGDQCAERYSIGTGSSDAKVRHFIFGKKHKE